MGCGCSMDQDLSGAWGFRAEIAMEIDSFNNIKRLVAAGFGPSILPLYAVQSEVSSGVILRQSF